MATPGQAARPPSYRIEFKPSVAKELGDLPRHIQKRVARWLNRLAADPRCPGHRKLEGMGGLYRVHASRDHVIIYQIDDARSTVLVVRIADRKEAYRGL